MSEIVLFRNISRDKTSLMNYHAIKGALPAVMLYDATNKAPFEGEFNYTIKDYKRFPLLSPSKMKLFFDDVLKGWVTQNTTIRQMWFNAGYCVLLFFLKNPGYDFYWSIEDDCHWHGDWKDFFKIYENEDADFLGPFLKNISIPQNKFEANQAINNFDYPQLFKSFGPIQRYSAKLLKEVIKALKQRKYAYYETLFPTVAFNSGLKIKDLNEGLEKPVYTDNSIFREKMGLYQLIHSRRNLLWHRVR